MVQIRCDKPVVMVKMTELAKLRNPKNRNQHPQDQIEDLAKQMQYQGVRHPIIISNRTGKFVAGDGRFLAARHIDLTEYPVSYQDFDSEEQEYSFGIADNALQQRSLLDFKGINEDLPDLGPDFDINLLGIKDFTLDLADKFEEPPPKNEARDKDAELKTCPNCGVLIE